MHRYRRQPEFIAGLLLFSGSLLYLLLAASARDDWVIMILIGCITFGFVCIHDTITEHYCLLLHRLGYGKQAFPDSPGVASSVVSELVGNPVAITKQKPL